MNARTANHRPMLAATADLADVVPGYLVSAKLDGVRAINLNGALLTRSLKPVPNRHLQALWAGAHLHGLDGELIVGDPTAPDVYRVTTSAVMTQAGTPDATLYLFDDFTDPDLPYTARLERLHTRALALRDAGLPVEVLAQTPVDAETTADAIEARILAAGYEGIIARRPDARYKFGRSTLKEGYLLKVKRFADAEAVIVRAVELLHNGNEARVNALGLTERASHQDNLIPGATLGALEVRDLKTGIAFSIGSGFDQATRQALWDARDRLPGQLVTYRHFPIGAYDKPRFPTFKGLRAPEDMAA